MSFVFPPFRPWTPTHPCRILSWASAVPPRAVSNAEIAARHGLTLPDAMVRRTIGVASRFVAEPDLADSDLLAQAARACLSQADLAVEQLSKLLVTKFLGDRILPPTASIVQRKLGSNLAFPCMDVDGGSNGFLQALDTAARCIQTGDEHILVASGGLAHGFTSRTDLRTAFLYGDGAAALLLGPSDRPHILGSYFFSNPAFLDHTSGVRFLEITAIDFEAPDAPERMRDLLRVGNWKDQKDFLLEAARTTIDRLLSGTGLSLSDIDRFLVSEPNGPLHEAILEHAGIPRERTVAILPTHGHTMSAQLPLQWCEAQARDPLPEGRRTLFLSLGEGISGGGLIYQH